jgi:hypothetical protein
MIDHRNPTEQFHSYQEPGVTPQSETARGGLGGMLDRFGMGNMRGSMGNVDMKQSVDKARTYAAANPGKVLGGLAALVIGAGLMRGRR